MTKTTEPHEDGRVVNRESRPVNPEPVLHSSLFHLQMSVISAVTMALLEAIRQAKRPGPLFGMAHEQAERLLRDATEPVLREVGLTFIVLNSCRCCIRELCRNYRLHYGGQLASLLELSLHKYHEHHEIDMATLGLLLARVDAIAGPAAEVWCEKCGIGVAR